MEQPEVVESSWVPRTPVRPTGGGFLAMRGVLVGLGVLLGVLLVSRGAVIIGGILLVMAALRIVMLVQMHRRREMRRERREQIAARFRARRSGGF
jgi:predicted lipid-binding transport protein (Tim44 family)